jgi:hypothetical protein
VLVLCSQPTVCGSFITWCCLSRSAPGSNVTEQQCRWSAATAVAYTVCSRCTSCVLQLAVSETPGEAAAYHKAMHADADVLMADPPVHQRCNMYVAHGG